MSEKKENQETRQPAVSKVNPQIEKESRQILNSIATELATQKHPVTRIGVIADVRKGPDYDKTRERVLVISYADGYVYMFEKEAPAWVSKETRSSLIGKEISFKPIGVTENYICVSGKFVTDMYRLAMERGDKLRGTVQSIYYDRDDDSKSYLILSCYGDQVKMMKSEYSIFGTPSYLPLLIGRKSAFRVIDVNEDGEVFTSAAVLEAERRDEVIEDLKNKPEGVMAVITKINPRGAYLNYNGVPMILRNRDFATDYTPVDMVKRRGDSMLVKLKELSSTRRILVEPVQKYISPASTARKFEKGQVTVGIVTGTSTWGVFVRIESGIDALCAVPEFRDPERGDRVNVRITRISEQKLSNGSTKMQIKGVITNILPPEKPKPLINKNITSENESPEKGTEE